jgi:hypothetical protein
LLRRETLITSITNVLIFWKVAICPSLCNIDLNEVKFGTCYNIRDKEHQPCGMKGCKINDLSNESHPQN